MPAQHHHSPANTINVRVPALQTAAAVLDVLDAVLAAPAQQQEQQPPCSTMGFCLVRPPGHHVKASRPMGFGLINFIAVAARYALQQPAINKVGAGLAELSCN